LQILSGNNTNDCAFDSGLMLKSNNFDVYDNSEKPSAVATFIFKRITIDAEENTTGFFSQEDQEFWPPRKINE
jgi:hypothetical protein